jgi:hypothetical protein
MDVPLIGRVQGMFVCFELLSLLLFMLLRSLVIDSWGIICMWAVGALTVAHITLLHSIPHTCCSTNSPTLDTAPPF